MPVVSDADVIIHLAKLNKLGLLEKLYGEVSIPGYIKGELLFHPTSSESKRIKGALDRYITIHSVDKKYASGLARRHKIHEGEANVKALAEKLDARLFLSNEKRVRISARQEGFKVTGTIGVLLKGLKERMVSKSEVERLFKKMRTKKEFRIHPDILDKALKALDGFH